MPLSNMFRRSRLFSLLDAACTDQDSIEDNVHHARKHLATLLQMAWFVEARDPYTGGHLWRVSRYSQLLARESGLDQRLAAQAGLGGFLHDLGKIAIPDAILRKPDKLNDEEYAIIKTHPAVGLRMLAAHPFSALVRDAVYLHHERPDGKGYPNGLSGRKIPVLARIVGICDAFDAMTSFRTYRKAMSMKSALMQLHQMAGQQFDSSLVMVMDTLWHTGALHHVQGHSDDGIKLQSCLMCGPTLVVARSKKEGDHVYCGNCTGEYRIVQKPDGSLGTAATGGMGTPQQLEPEADISLIMEFIEGTVKALPVAALLNEQADTGLLHPAIAMTR